MASLELRGNIWHIRWRDKRGKLRSESTKIPHSETGDKSAIQKLAVFERRLLRGLEPPAPVTVGKLLDGVVSDYKTNARKSLKDADRRIELHLRPFFGLTRAAVLRTADIRDYIAERQTAKASNGTINRELTLLGRAFALGKIGGEIETAPHIPKLAESAPRKGFFEADQFERLVAALPEAYRPFVTFLYLTGWRVSEVRGLQWRHVDFAGGEIRLDPGTTKNGEGRTFPMTVELREILTGLENHAPAPGNSTGSGPENVAPERMTTLAKFVFVYRRRKDGPALPIGDIGKVWALACEAAGLPVVATIVKDAEGKPVLNKKGSKYGKPGTPRRVVKAYAILHDFRRTAVRNLVRAGIPERVAMQMTGHKTRSVFDRYSIVSRGDLETAREKLDLFANRSQSNIIPFRVAETK